MFWQQALILRLFVAAVQQQNQSPVRFAADHPPHGLHHAAHPRKEISHVEAVPFDGVEAFNSRSALNVRARGLAEELNLGQTGGSDAHSLREIGNGLTHVETERPPTVQDVMQAIRENRTAASGRRARIVGEVARAALEAFGAHVLRRARGAG